MRRAMVFSFGLTALFPCGAALAQINPARPQGNLFQTLIQLDVNIDRTVERSEVPESATNAFERLLKHGDTNKDGKLQLDEIRGLGEKLRALGPPPGEDRFKAQDKDGDGKVSRVEFQGPAEAFDRLDANKDGFLDRGEARQGFLAATVMPLNPMILDRVLGMDKDKDGKITREEFQGPQPVFTRLDADGDQVVTRKEIEAYRPAANAPEAGKPDEPRRDSKPTAPSAAAAGAIGQRFEKLKAMDKDKDGKITREEFEGPPAIFGRLDADNDGKITREELKDGVSKLRNAAAKKNAGPGASN